MKETVDSVTERKGGEGDGEYPEVDGECFWS